MQVLRRDAHRRGGSIFEIVLVLPVFATVLVTAVEFGRAFLVGQLVTNTAREACRLATRAGTTESAVSAFVRDTLGDTLSTGEVDVAVSVSVNGSRDAALSSAAPRDLIDVELAVPFEKVCWLPATFLSGTSLKSRATMCHE